MLLHAFDRLPLGKSFLGDPPYICYRLHDSVTVCSLLSEFSSWADSCHPDEGGATFIRNVGPYKLHTA
jgi:hypothetical protein